MKKVLSVFLAICVMLMTSITAFAAEVPASEKVEKQINGAVAYLTKGVESYGIDDAVNFSNLTDTEADLSKFEDGFIKAVKANLDANDGKIVPSFGENLATYGAVINALLNLGEDTTDFYGYNIEKAFMAMDPAVLPSSPNYYRIIIQGAYLCDDSDKFVEALCDTYISNYYEMGKGVDYYGYACDNTAYFIDAIACGNYLVGKYDDVLKDAIKVLDTYKVDGGYCYNPGMQANADSTALALMAHCAYSSVDMDIEDNLDAYFELVNGIYADLCKFEGSAPGVFTFDGEDSAYATQEGLVALSYYYFDVLLQEYIRDSVDEEEEPTTDADIKKPVKKPTTTVKTETTTSAPATTKTNTSKKSPNTGADVTAVSASIALFAAAGVFTVLKKKTR